MSDGHLRKTAHEQQRNERADGVADQYAGAGETDGEAAAQEESRADGATDGDHGELAGGESAVQALFSFGDGVEAGLCVRH